MLFRCLGSAWMIRTWQRWVCCMMGGMWAGTQLMWNDQISKKTTRSGELGNNQRPNRSSLWFNTKSSKTVLYLKGITYVVLTGYSMKDDLKDHFKLPVSVTAFFIYLICQLLNYFTGFWIQTNSRRHGPNEWFTHQSEADSSHLSNLERLT